MSGTLIEFLPRSGVTARQLSIQPEKIARIDILDGDEADWIGLRIVTDRREIELLIDNERDCCEYWGYFSTPDEVTDFIGAELLSVGTLDSTFDNHRFEFWEGEEDKTQMTAFVNIETDRGQLQLAVYNVHNGYYGHKVILRNGRMKEEREV